MENYFWNTEERVRKKQVYVLIIYDIVSNRVRNAFAKKMEGYGFRIQKSAFEAMIDESLYHQLLETIPNLINLNEDTVRVYRIRGAGEVSLFGQSPTVTPEETIII